MTEKPAGDWDDAVSCDEMVARFADIIDLPIRDLPRDEELRIAHSEVRDSRFDPVDATWLRLYVVVDDGTVELGQVARATFRREPPSPS